MCMETGSQFIAIGLAVVLIAIIFEYFEIRLTGIAVGFGLVIIGFALLMTNATTDRTPP